jgi:hypothetical protein
MRRIAWFGGMAGSIDMTGLFSADRAGSVSRPFRRRSRVDKDQLSGLVGYSCFAEFLRQPQRTLQAVIEFVYE